MDAEGGWGAFPSFPSGRGEFFGNSCWIGITIDYNNVWNNTSGNYYNCSPGPNDISADPEFVGVDDFHLQPTSPCIDVGSNTAPGIQAYDFDGNLRISNFIVDMDAYEYQYPPLPDTDLGLYIYPKLKRRKIKKLVKY